MSDAGPAQSEGWRRSHFVLSLVAIVALVTVAVSGGAPLPVTVLAALVVAGFSLYLAAPRRAGRGDSAKVQPAPDLTNIADSARSILECVDEPILILDPGGRVLFANRASQPVVGAD